MTCIIVDFLQNNGGCNARVGGGGGVYMQAGGGGKSSMKQGKAAGISS